MKKYYGSLRFVIALLTFSSAIWPASPPRKPLSQLACDANASEEGPWKPALQIFRPQHVLNEKAKSCSSWKCVPKQISADFLFASLADPEQTPFALEFDRSLESIVWAIEDDGYALQAYWLPWTAASNIYTGLGDQQCVRKLREQRRKQPGLLIFIGNSSSRFLLVWLLGETPSSGIDKTMLGNAIDYSRIFDPGLIHFDLLGPNFSGSLVPLAKDIESIDGEIKGGVYFHVISGTATKLANIKQFSNEMQNEEKKEHRKVVTYESAVENDLQTASLFLNYMQSRLTIPISFLVQDETAILSEDETAYGDVDLIDTLKKPADSHNWLMVRYPSEIRRLRTSNQTELGPAPSVQQDTSNNGQPSAPKDGVPNTSDSVPDLVTEFSRQQSPASQEAVLQSVAASLRRERVSYAGIVATDVLDSVFLAHFFRSTDPDTRLFTIDSDLLFFREGDAEPLMGMLSVANYPLFSRNQHWTAAELTLKHLPRRVQFASRSAEGIYNACRRLLSLNLAANVLQPHSVNRSQAYLEQHAFFEYGSPALPSSGRPPVWLTVVGRDGYWPVALLDDENGDSVKKPSGANHSTITDFAASAGAPAFGSEKIHPEEPSRGWSLLFWGACLFCLAHVFYMLKILFWQEERPFSSNAQTRISMRDLSDKLIRFLHHLFDVYPNDHRPTEFERPYLLAATLSLLSSLFLFAFPLYPFSSYPRYQVYFIMASVCLMGLSVVALQLMRGKRRYGRILFLSWFLTVPFAVAWWYLITDKKYKAGMFFAYRALFLGNGVSPGIPIVLLAAAFYGWAWVHLQRESEVRVRRTFRDRFTDPWPPLIQDRINETDNSIEDVLSSDIWLPALALLLLWFLVLYPPQSLRTFEFYLYEIIYELILTAVYWCIWLVFVQMLLVWRQLRKLLETLERHPIRNAFSRLDKEISWIPLVSAHPTSNLVVSIRSMECLKALHTLASELECCDPKVREAVGNPDSKLNMAFNAVLHERAGGEGCNPDYLRLQDELASLTRHFIRCLARDWARGHSESVVNELQRRNQTESLDSKSKVTILQEEFIALRLLLYIRYVLRQLRNWLGFLIGGFIISIISMNSYPFQAHRWIGLASLITFVAIGAGIAMVFAEMDRNRLLSRIAYTRGDRIGPAFFLRLARFGALPLLTVLAAQYASVNRVLFFWVKPMFDALK